MSNLGYQILYRLLNALPDVVCERAFLPQVGGAPLASVESRKPLSQFKILAFSIPFENDIPNLLTILGLAKIPILAQRRGKMDPLVIAGGAAVTLNPEPIAPFVDICFIGEGEEVIREFMRLYQEAGGDKGVILQEACRIEGVYTPSLYDTLYDDRGRLAAIIPRAGVAPQRVRRRWVKDLDMTPGVSSILTPYTEFKRTPLMEINRGCPRRCRFCAVRGIYAPMRNRSERGLLTTIDHCIQGAGRIGILGSAIGDHPGFTRLCEQIVNRGGGLTISSIRADAVTEQITRLLAAGGLRTVAIAPEAGTERLRKVIAKGISDEEILSAVAAIAEVGIEHLRLYFIIGLPTETWEDCEGILTLLKRLRHQMIKWGKYIRELSISIAPFCPKPWTPFQWHPYEEIKRLKEKLQRLKKGIAKIPGCRLFYDLPKWGYIQALLSLGDRRVAEILIRVHQHQGDWGVALKESPINPDFWVYRVKTEDEVFPWDFIDHGIDKGDLWEEYKEALGNPIQARGLHDI